MHGRLCVVTGWANDGERVADVVCRVHGGERGLDDPSGRQTSAERRARVDVQTVVVVVVERQRDVLWRADYEGGPKEVAVSVVV